MVKTILGVTHQGLRDWTVQRVSAVYMLLYILSAMIYVSMHPHVDFGIWHDLFANQGVKVATLLFVASILSHAWIGMWTVFTDYLKFETPWVAVFINVVVFLSLVACFFWALLILWGV